MPDDIIDINVLQLKAFASPEVVFEIYCSLLELWIDSLDSSDVLEEVGEAGHQEVVPAHNINKEILRHFLHLITKITILIGKYKI